MSKMTMPKWIKFFASGTLLLLASCQQDLKHGEDFIPDNQVHEQARLMETQAAAGARGDATLYSGHFDGTALSTLGQAKLDLMLKDEAACNPITVYLSIPEDNRTSDREVAVTNYLKDRGNLKSAQINLVLGINPDNTTPAEPNLKALQKTDTGGAGGDYSSGGSSSGGSSSSAGH